MSPSCGRWSATTYLQCSDAKQKRGEPRRLPLSLHQLPQRSSTPSLSPLCLTAVWGGRPAVQGPAAWMGTRRLRQLAAGAAVDVMSSDSPHFHGAERERERRGPRWGLKGLGHYDHRGVMPFDMRC